MDLEHAAGVPSWTFREAEHSPAKQLRVSPHTIVCRTESTTHYSYPKSVRRVLLGPHTLSFALLETLNGGYRLP